jgi:plasmid segregation protein ParM
MSKSKPTPVLQSPIRTLGLDIGYGVVKAVTAEQIFTFPSVCGHAREIKFQTAEIAQKHPGDQLTDDDGAWFIGELALAQLSPGELLRLRGRTANEMLLGNVFRKRLAKAVIGKLMAGITDGGIVHLRIATGLPVDHMRDAPELKAALMGQHIIQTDSAHCIANVTEVMVMPQPYGCIFAHTLTPTGEINRQHTYARTGVCDVGTYTVDLTLDDDGQYIDVQSGSVEGGVFTAQERIATLLEQRYRQKFPYKTIDQVLRTGEFRAHGQLVDLRSSVEEALAPLRSATLNLLGEKWQSGANVDVIYLCGGGAELVLEGVQEVYPHAQLVRDAQLANARGYLNYARFIENQTQGC